MDNRSDSELLEVYARTNASGAFSQLVFRHVDMVYTAARRQVGDPHLAEDVTQAVFLVLAQKAAKIGAHVVLHGWLLNATRFAARDALRSSLRRRRHETSAALQRSPHVYQCDPSSLTPEVQQEDLDRLDRVLDSALVRLGNANRDAVVLRFFHDKSFRDVVQALGIGEQAAKQRVSRGLKRLRGMLAKSGANFSSQGLGLALLARGIRPAPAGLGHSIAVVGGKASIASASSVALAKGAMTLMAWTNAKIVVAASAALLLLSGGAVVVAHHYHTAGNRVMAIAPVDAIPGAGSPLPPASISWGTRPPPQRSNPYAGPAITGTVVDPEGKPVSGASVAFSSVNYSVNVYQSPAANLPPGTMATTDSNGHFELTPSEQPSAIVVRSATGYAAAVVRDPANPILISLAPWARLEGVVRHGSNPVPNALVQVAQYDDKSDFDRWHLIRQTEVQADENGHFVVDHLVPGLNNVGRIDSRNQLPQRHYALDLPAGKTTFIKVGGSGRTIVGHLPPAAAGFSFGNGTIQLVQPELPKPPNWDTLDTEEQKKLEQQFWNTPAYKAWQQNANVAQFNVRKDGTFEAQDIPAADYQVSIQVGDSEGGSGFFIETAGWGVTPLTVAPFPADQIDQPLDVGEVHVTLEKRIGIGQAVPEIAGDSPDNKPARLSDYRGKYVLLYLWSSDRQDMIDNIDSLKAFSDRFSDKATVIGLNVDESPDVAAKSVLAQGIHWPQILMRGWDDPRLPREYLHSPAGLFLIDAQGKLLAKNADVPAMFTVLQQVLVPNSSANIRFDHFTNDKDHWIPESSPDNVARDARITLVDGIVYPKGGAPRRLQDGRLPDNSDAPTQCFFFDMGTLEGRFRVDLDAVTAIDRINTYSWHKSDRGPQLYKLYGAAGDLPEFELSPKIGIDPTTCGWKEIARVDTRPTSGPLGGQYIVHITDPSGSLGSYRHLLFETFAAETNDAYGHTFYCEVEVFRHPK
jgi:RNA polymerase sigma factor (sigma-70 family)